MPPNKLLYRLLILIAFGLSVFLPARGIAQGSLLPPGSLEETLLGRFEIKANPSVPFHTGLKPFNRAEVVAYAHLLDTVLRAPNKKTRADLAYIFRNNNEWGSPDTSAQTGSRPLLGFLYRSPANFYEVNTPDFTLRANPMIQFKYGAQQNETEPWFLNQRGVELRAAIDQRVFVYANFIENQAQFPSFVRERFLRDSALPGVGRAKDYSGFGVRNGYDFMLSQSAIGFQLTPHIGAQFGYGRNFWGEGYRSLLLSDFGYDYLHLKINWKIWKLHYQNLFAELNAGSGNGPDGLVAKKYMASHLLSVYPLPNVQVGLFEAVIFSRENHFELNYLNPLILYRAVELALGSPDNMLLGIHGKWNFLRHFQAYGQFVFDEFLYAELLVRRRGWWGNKFAMQTGLKYVDAFGIDHLDLQIEHNLARPYTYTHDEQVQSYTHQMQPLAHPLGANFQEWVLLARWQALPRLLVQGRLLQARTGSDGAGENWGSNILLPNVRIQQEFGNEIGQGIPTRLQIAALDLSFSIAHNVFFDLHGFYRRRTLDGQIQNHAFLSGGIRMNLPNWKHDF